MASCKECGKDFETEAALHQHMKSKHGAHHAEHRATHTGQKSSNKMIIWSIVAIVLIGILYFALKPSGLSGNDAFAQCLTEKGVKFYGAFWCPHCADQKKLFGSSMKYAPYVECSTPDGKGQLQVCIDANITGYPTWEFSDGSRREGVISLQELSDITGCALQ